MIIFSTHFCACYFAVCIRYFGYLKISTALFRG